MQVCPSLVRPLKLAGGGDPDDGKAVTVKGSYVWPAGLDPSIGTPTLDVDTADLIAIALG